MKYSFLIAVCGLFLMSCRVREERFVNPIFYNTLYPISKTVSETRLTPTKIYTDSAIPEEDCRLLKNTERVLEFSCEYDNPLSGHFSDVFYRYVLEEEDPLRKNCLPVRLEMHGGEAWFCIRQNQ